MKAQKKTTEPALGPENPLLRTLIDGLPDYIFIKDRQSRFLVNNLAHARVLGAAHPNEVAGKTDLDIFPAELAKQYYADEQALMKSGQPLNREERVVDPKTGETRWLQTTKTPLKDQAGMVVGLMGISRDITERKRAETALRQSRDELEKRVAERTAELSERNTSLQQQIAEREWAEEALTGTHQLLETMLDNVPDRIYFKDAQSRFLELSQALAKRLGLKGPEEAVGKTDFDFHPPEKAREFFQDEQRIIQTGQPLINKIEKQITASGEVAWASVTKVPLRDPQGKVIGLVGINRDLTELKRAEKELERTHRRLLDVSRLAGMAEVATGVLHNVGNVLNSVNVSAALISERLRESKVAGVTKLAKLLQEHSEDMSRFLTEDKRGHQVPLYLEQLAEHLEEERNGLRDELKNLTVNIEHIKEIVTTQQNYAQISGLTESVTLPDLVEDALRIHSGAYVRHGVTVVREFEPLPAISVDKHKVLQILVNLLSNAKYACDEGGRGDKQVMVRLKPAGEGRVKIEVADNGVGIAAENLVRIFSQGFTLRKGGHGFGLHSGALAARDLGGSLSVYSDGLGRGASFVLELPVAPMHPESDKPLEEP